MANNSTDELLKAAGVVAAGAGLGLVIGAAVANYEIRAKFAQSLRSRLHPAGVSLISSELGREAGGAIWILTVQLSNKTVLTFQVPVTSPHLFSYPVATWVADCVLGYLREQHLVSK